MDGRRLDSTPAQVERARGFAPHLYATAINNRHHTTVNLAFGDIVHMRAKTCIVCIRAATPITTTRTH